METEIALPWFRYIKMLVPFFVLLTLWNGTKAKPRLILPLCVSCFTFAIIELLFLFQPILGFLEIAETQMVLETSGNQPKIFFRVEKDDWHKR